jgi:hypothetical protein
VLCALQASAPYEIVSFTNCFHGRTMGALALTYKEQYKTPFLPVMPGHVLAEYNNLDSAAQVGVSAFLVGGWRCVCARGWVGGGVLESVRAISTGALIYLVHK